MDTKTLEKLWNDSADQFNQWSELCEDEKIEFALAIGRKNGLKDAKEISRTTLNHLASPLAPYNHGVLDTQTAITKAICQRIEELP